MLEFTYVMIKPDGVEKGIISDVIDTFHSRELEVISIETDNLEKSQVKEHYAHLEGREFFDDLVNFMTSGPVMKMIVLGDDAVTRVRRVIGPTNVKEAQRIQPNSIRAKYGNPDFGPANAIHASDSKESALIEIERFYGLKMTQPEPVAAKVNVKKQDQR